MKKISSIFTILVSLILVLANMTCAFAVMDSREDYEYTIRVYAGREGKFVDPQIGTLSDGGKTLTITKKAGESVTIDESTTGFVLDSGSEYYPRGFRIAGHDAGFSNKEVSNPTFTVDEDRSLEVAYGLKGGMVEYTVRYVDENENDIRTADTYYGMVGDRPVISYKYVEGYQPRAYNLKGTLKESGNEWLFPYTKVSQSPSDSDDDNGDGNSNGNGGSSSGNNSNSGTASGGNSGNGTGADSNAGQEGADGTGANDGDNAGPADVIDIDDPATPQSQDPGTAGGSDESMKSGVSPAAIGGGAAVIAAAAIAAALVRRRRRDEEAE